MIDYDTARSGEQRSGLYFAAWGLATKLSLALSVGLVFPVLAWSGFDTTGAQAMPETALDTLSSLYAWFPILPKAAAIAVMWNFPLGEDAQRVIAGSHRKHGRAAKRVMHGLMPCAQRSCAGSGQLALATVQAATKYPQHAATAVRETPQIMSTTLTETDQFLRVARLVMS